MIGHGLAVVADTAPAAAAANRAPKGDALDPEPE